MSGTDPILLAQQSLLSSGLVNLVVLDAEARIEAAQGAQVADWQSGENVVDRLFVLAGMEAIISAMAAPGAKLDPIELPAVFLGGNHEDGDFGVSVRLSRLADGRVLLLLRPLEAAGAVDQKSVQQHNDLALLRGQMENAKSQAELNLTARENLFDTLRWGFRAPVATLAQALQEQTALAPLAQNTLKAVDDWLDLLSLKTRLDAGDARTDEPIAVPSLMARLADEFDIEINAEAASFDAVAGRLTGSAEALETALSGLLRAVQGTIGLQFAVANASAHWRISGVENASAITADYRFELARTAALFLQGSITVNGDQVTLSLPLNP